MRELEMGLNLQEGEGIRTAVDVFLIDSITNKILLGLRKAKAGEKTWGFPGGHQKTGEKILETAERELKEELGDKVVFKLVDEIVAVRENKIPPWHVPHITVIIRGEYESGSPIAAPGEKTADWDWFDLESLPSPLFSGVEETVLNYLQGNKVVVTDWLEA